MILGLLVLVSFLFLGEATSALLPIPMPGNVLGMLYLALALQFRIVRLEHVKPAADALIKLMPFLFVPAGVGILAFGGVLRREWLPIVAASVISTLAVMLSVGWIQQRMERR